MPETLTLLNVTPETGAAAENATDIRANLLAAGITEFANRGYDGARLERIAAAANCAKRMLYYYFGNKQDVYLAVLDFAYSGIRSSEGRLDLDRLSPLEALHLLARETFVYHETHHDFTRLVLQENFGGAKHLASLPTADKLREAALGPLQKCLDRGRKDGLFNQEVTANEVHFLISAISSFRVDHAGTWKSLLRVDLLAPASRERQVTLLLSQLDALVMAHPTEVQPV